MSADGPADGTDLDRTDPDGTDPDGPHLWGEVVGQDVAVARLRASVTDPVHAYLLVGPEGSGTREAARAFAADLLVDGADPATVASGRRQVGAEAHPALTVVERVGASIDRDQMDDVVRRAHMAPPVGDRQVIVLVDLHLAAQSPKLLKTLEEPPPSTVLVVLAEEIPPEMVTVASRCVVVEFDSVAQGAIAERLVSEGVDAEQARIAAAGAGGSMTQARLLANDPNAALRRERWYSVPDRLDGTGATAMALVDEVLAATDEVAAPLTERHDEELAAFDAQVYQLGARMAGPRNAMIARHKREQRRVRTADLLSGLATLVSRYRDALEDGVPADRFLAAADAVQELTDSVRFNPNVTLQLQALFVALPPLR